MKELVEKLFRISYANSICSHQDLLTLQPEDDILTRLLAQKIQCSLDYFVYSVSCAGAITAVCQQSWTRTKEFDFCYLMFCHLHSSPN